MLGVVHDPLRQALIVKEHGVLPYLRPAPRFWWPEEQGGSKVEWYLAGVKTVRLAFIADA